MLHPMRLVYTAYFCLIKPWKSPHILYCIWLKKQEDSVDGVVDNMLACNPLISSSITNLLYKCYTTINRISLCYNVWVCIILPVHKSQEFLIDRMREGEAASHHPYNSNPNTALCQGHARSQRVQNHLKENHHTDLSQFLHLWVSVWIEALHLHCPHLLQCLVALCNQLCKSNSRSFS